ncbi:hypothetical protein ACI2VH_02630 [Ralstonia nicotianae]
MTTTKERPILFSGAMVSAILDGRKTQTRRIISPQPTVDERGLLWWKWSKYSGSANIERLGQPSDDWLARCPYGQPGDRLWVREAFMHEPADYCWEASVSIPVRPATTIYRADSDPRGEAKGCGWKPSIHMPRALSRITLEITGVRVERLQEINEEDARAEGVGPLRSDGRMRNGTPAIDGYADLWESINGAGSWAVNPWVWVVEFRRVAA